MINWVLIHYEKVEGIYLKKMYRVILAWTTDLKFHALSTLVHILLGVHLQPNGKSHSSDIEWLYQILLKNLKTILLINWKFNTNKVWMGSDVKGIINGFLFSLVSLDQHEHVTLQLENGKEKTTKLKLKRREKPTESSVLVVLTSQSNWSSVLMSFFFLPMILVLYFYYILWNTHYLVWFIQKQEGRNVNPSSNSIVEWDLTLPLKKTTQSKEVTLFHQRNRWFSNPKTKKTMFLAKQGQVLPSDRSQEGLVEFQIPKRKMEQRIRWGWWLL